MKKLVSFKAIFASYAVGFGVLLLLLLPAAIFLSWSDLNPERTRPDTFKGWVVILAIVAIVNFCSGYVLAKVGKERKWGSLLLMVFISYVFFPSGGTILTRLIDATVMNAVFLFGLLCAKE